MGLARKELRQQFRQRRRLLSQEQQAAAAHHLVSCAQNHQVFKPNTVIAAYVANDGELDPSLLIHYLWEKRITVCLPVLHPFNSKTLLFLKYDVAAEMKKNKYNITEPCLDVRRVVPINQIDIILTPLVAFDSLGNRLGMGGGFYDRSLASAKRNNKFPKLIGIAHELQKTEHLPIESWDVPLDQILTPAHLYAFA